MPQTEWSIAFEHLLLKMYLYKLNEILQHTHCHLHKILRIRLTVLTQSTPSGAISKFILKASDIKQPEAAYLGFSAVSYS